MSSRKSKPNRWEVQVRLQFNFIDRLYDDSFEEAFRFRLIQDILKSVLPISKSTWENSTVGGSMIDKIAWKYMKTFKRRLDTDTDKISLIKEIIRCVMQTKNKLASTEGVGRFHPASVQIYFDDGSNEWYSTPTFQI